MKTAIVTGASSGIGLEITRMLLELDYRVYAFGRNFPPNLPNSKCFCPITCDITNTLRLTEHIKEIQKQEEIHLLVNNAGVGYFGPHEELNQKKLHEMVSVNVEVPLLLSQLLLRDLKKHKGIIINISSVTASKSNTHGCAYGATKAALTSFSASLFDEVRKYGVKVCTIHPDMTKSNFYRNADFKEGETSDTYLLPEEVAKAVQMMITSRDGLVVSEITLKPQLHRLQKINDRRKS
ncbi:SDR family NAD(P)-dependent oxidoreductase [Anaerocolumna jejuensis]|uniref:SDR family NAD(P)-dependent oxidoreductase n=1 Tax=Anaerocolumna jejuensis TaxID=259063 RepID=UPI003F7CC895